MNECKKSIPTLELLQESPIATVVKFLTKGLCSESGLHSLPSRSSRCPRINRPLYLTYGFREGEINLNSETLSIPISLKKKL